MARSVAGTERDGNGEAGEILGSGAAEVAFGQMFGRWMGRKNSGRWWPERFGTPVGYPVAQPSASSQAGFSTENPGDRRPLPLLLPGC